MTTISRTMTILCPDWCRQDEFGHDPYLNADDQLEVDHAGPKFGTYMYGCAAQVDDEVTTRVTVSDLEDRDMTPAELRRLAADALTAAEWLEAHS